MANPSFLAQQVQRARDFATVLGRRFVEERCLVIAASLSYTSLLALVPLIAIGFAVLSAFPVFQQAQVQLQDFIFESFVPSAAATAKDYITEFVGKAQGLTAAGIIGLAVTALLLFNTIEAAMNAIFQVRRSRPIVTRLLVFWALLSLGPLLMGASFSVATALYAEALGSDRPAGLLNSLTVAVPTILSGVALAFLYLIMPNRRVAIGHAIIGAMIAAMAFSALRWTFTLYVTTFPSYQNLYGTLATVPIFLFWMYLSWAVVLIGAVITATLPEWGRRRADQAKPAYAHDGGRTPAQSLHAALAILGQLYRQSQEGGALDEPELLAAVDVAGGEVLDVLVRLRAAGLVEHTVDDGWVAARDPAAVTLNDIVDALDLELAPVTPALAEGGMERHWRDAQTADDDRDALAELLANAVRQRRETLSVPLRTLLIEHDLHDAPGAGAQLQPSARAGVA